jgi:hypothetical protein
MGEVLQLLRRWKPGKDTGGYKEIQPPLTDRQIREALAALAEYDKHLAKVVRLNLMEVCKRLDTLEGIVFAQSILIAQLRGKPLGPKQQGDLYGVLRRKRKKNLDLG